MVGLPTDPPTPGPTKKHSDSSRRRAEVAAAALAALAASLALVL